MHSDLHSSVRSSSLSWAGPEDERLIDQQCLPPTAPPEDSGLELYGSVKLLEPWFPAVNPLNPQAKTWRTRRSRREVILWGCFIGLSIVCLTNFSLGIWALVHYKKNQDGVVVLFHGNCNNVKWADTVAHVMINILSTLIFGVSNLILQLLVAPTRKEVDQAHAKGEWLDIGVPSYRNLWGIARSRAIHGGPWPQAQYRYTSCES